MWALQCFDWLHHTGLEGCKSRAGELKLKRIRAISLWRGGRRISLERGGGSNKFHNLHKKTRLAPPLGGNFIIKSTEWNVHAHTHTFRYILDPERHQLVEYNYGGPAEIEAAPNPAPSRWWSCHLASNSSNNNSSTSATLTRQQQRQREQQQHNLGTFYCPNRRQDEHSTPLHSA